jgi:hypothetical protein
MEKEREKGRNYKKEMGKTRKKPAALKCKIKM